MIYVSIIKHHFIDVAFCVFAVFLFILIISWLQLFSGFALLCFALLSVFPSLDILSLIFSFLSIQQMSQIL